MNGMPGANEWSAARGGKWSAYLAGMEAMLAPLNEPLVHALELMAPVRIADIGCGGGGATLEILRRAPAGSLVHGFDISPDSIEAARAGLPPGERAISFFVKDMAVAPAPEEGYGRLVSRFGVMFFPDPPAAFRNLWRWLAPGGRFSCAVWGAPAGNPWMTVVREVVAGIVSLPPSDPEAPGPFRYAEVGKLVALLDGAGFREVAASAWHGGLSIGGGLSAAEAASFALASFSSFAEVLAAAGEPAMEEAHRVLTERLSRFQQHGVVRMEAAAHIVTGVRVRP